MKNKITHTISEKEHGLVPYKSKRHIKGHYILTFDIPIESEVDIMREVYEDDQGQEYYDDDYEYGVDDVIYGISDPNIKNLIYKLHDVCPEYVHEEVVEET